MNKKIKSEL